ncbi:hypothetical protein FRB96_007564 [Tulasnella sp. 330]|nr:hypothetical protein FRB96_007564 [Tulasnella sp. 330]
MSTASAAAPANVPEVTTTASSSVGIIVADVHGSLHLLGGNFVPVHSWVAHQSGRVTHIAEERGILISVGEEDAIKLPLLKIWDLEHFDKRTGSPLLLRSIKIQAGSKPHPVSTIALSESLSHLAIGFGDGSVMVYRNLDQSLFSGSTSLTALPKPKTIHESPAEPITGLGFREPSVPLKAGDLLHLFIVTTNRVLCYIAGGKGSGGPPLVVDEVGCGLGCAVMDPVAREMIVARDEAIYLCGPEGRGACYAYEGPKSRLLTLGTYVIIVSPPFFPAPSNASATVRNFVARAPDPTTVSQQDISKVTIFDLENKFVAFSGPFREGVRDIMYRGDEIYVLTNDGSLFHLEEKSTAVKLDTLFRQSRYLLAINLARSSGVDESGIADIHRQYGDHLYLKGDDDGAMQQYVRTIGYLQPSYVIRKFLDAKRINNLTLFLQELHSRGLANADHTTLLLNTYTKLKDVARLDAFIKHDHQKSKSNGDAGDDDPPFDVDTGIRVCRQAGYFEHAVYLAKKYRRHEEYLRIQMEDAGNLKEALTYIRELGPEAAETNLVRYGRSMLSRLPDETTELLIDLCSGTGFGTAISTPPDRPSSPSKPSNRDASYLSYLTKNRLSSLSTDAAIVPAGSSNPSATITEGPPQISHRRSATGRRSHHDGDSSRAGSPPPTNSTQPNPPPPRIPSPRQYFAHFVDHLEHFQRFLEAVALNRWGQKVVAGGGSDEAPAKESQLLASPKTYHEDGSDEVAVWNTLIELYLTRSAQVPESEDSTGLRNKALAVLQDDTTFPYDRTHALLVCSTNHFIEGLVLLWEKMGMYEDILRFWMDKEFETPIQPETAHDGARPSDQVLRHLKTYGPAHPHLYLLVLRFLTSSPALLTRHTTDIMAILEYVDKEKIIPPLGIVQVLSRNDVASVGLVKEWLMRRISESRDEIAADKKVIDAYRTETKAKLQEVADLSDPNNPRIFHVTRCSSCSGPLDLPAVHFMCKHSYHQRCLQEHETECPNCARAHGLVKEIRRDNAMFAAQQDLFLANVKETGFEAIAGGFGKASMCHQRGRRLLFTPVHPTCVAVDIITSASFQMAVPTSRATDGDYETASNTLASLKSLKNTVVGDPRKKKDVVYSDTIPGLVEWILNTEVDTESFEPFQAIRLEVASVVSCLSNASPQTTLELVRASAISALMHALNELPENDAEELRIGLCRALRSIVSSCSTILDPRTGLKEDFSTADREDARQAVEQVLQAKALDVYLPLLSQPDLVSTGIAEMLHMGLSCWDSPSPRNVITEWLPLIERESKSPGTILRNRGWETAGRPEPAGSWVSDRLLKLLATGNRKAQEAALQALGALASDNSNLATALTRPASEKMVAPLWEILTYTTSRFPSVRLAACKSGCCIVRAAKPPKSKVALEICRPNGSAYDPALTLILLLRTIISDDGMGAPYQTQGCHMLAILVADERRNQELASQFGLLSLLLNHLHTNNPSTLEKEWAEDIPGTQSRFREAILISLASLTLHLDNLRRDLLFMTPSYLELLMAALDDSCVGVRYAACQCARALSRSVDVLRTSAIDSGLGMKLWHMLKTEKDRRVQVVLLMCMTNLVLDFSPLRETLLEQGVIQRMVELIDNGDESVTRNAVWAIRNTLYHCTLSDQMLVLNQLGMERLHRILIHPDSKVKQQAIILVRNTTTSSDSCAFVVQGLGRERIFKVLKDGIDDSDNETAQQSASLLLNLAQELEYSGEFPEQKEVLVSMRNRLSCRDPSTRKAILETIIALSLSCWDLLHELGFPSALKEILHEMEMNVSLGGDVHEENVLRDLARTALLGSRSSLL